MSILITLLAVTAVFSHAESLTPIQEAERESTDYDLLCSDSNITISFLGIELNRVSNSFLSSPLVKCLNFMGNSIRNIDPSAFDNLPNLKYLDVTNNNFDFNDIFHNQFFELEVLILDNTYRNYYQKTLTINSLYPKLRKLFIRSNNIGEVSCSKDSFPSLTHLYLGGNPFHQDKFDWLPVTLEYLDLTGHHLNSLTLKDLKNLKWILLDNSGGNSLNKLNFENLISLTYLSVPWNKIDEISATTFVNTTSLLHLDISSNNIKYIEGGSFDSMKNLKFLNISNNYIEIVQAGTFDKLNNLQTLILEKNIITTFPMIGNEMKLKELFLNCNILKSIVGGTFAKMPYLESLYLHDNEISYVDQQAFTGLQKLKTLTLSNNMLSILPPNWMLQMTSLIELDMAGNRFKDFGNLALSESSILQKLYLSNQLRYIRAQALFTIPENVTIDLDGNFAFVKKCVKDENKYTRLRYYG